MVTNHYEILSVMRQNQTARSETGFNDYPVEVTAIDIMLFTDYVFSIHLPRPLIMELYS
jgi:hypothetical protein